MILLSAAHTKSAMKAMMCAFAPHTGFPSKTQAIEAENPPTMVYNAMRCNFPLQFNSLNSLIMLQR